MEASTDPAPQTGADPTPPVDLSSSTVSTPEPSITPADPSSASDTSPPATPSLQDQLKAAAIEQSPSEPQDVPEVRPQTFTQPDPSAQSASSLTMTGAAAHGEAEYAAAAPTDENNAAAAEASQLPNFLVGQRVQITGPDASGVDQTGRMALVQSIVYTDPVNAMIAHMGGSEARFATVNQYVVLTRDGRSDTLVVAPANLKALDTTNGWGRGSI